MQAAFPARSPGARIIHALSDAGALYGSPQDFVEKR